MKRMPCGLLIVLVLVALGSCDFSDPDPYRQVEFTATSTSGFVTGNYYVMGGVAFFSDQASPWSVTRDSEEGDTVILTVLSSLGTGTVVARIYVDGALIGEASATDTNVAQVSRTVQ